MLSTKVLILSQVNQGYRAVWCREPTVKSAINASRFDVGMQLTRFIRMLE